MLSGCKLPYPILRKSGPLVSIDFLCGLTVALIILVNDNGDRAHAYWPLQHAEWNGFRERMPPTR
jgi:predicted acyltransferase